MKSVRINVTKIDKSAIYEGKNGKYVDLVLFENKNGEDQYGNLGFVTQDIGKERRLAGEKGPILGNWKELAGSREAIKEGSPGEDLPAGVSEDDDEIPF
jgi:hypothetical protein